MKIGIGGIKFSEELVHVTYREISLADGSFADLLLHLSRQRINLPFVCQGRGGDEIVSTFCVATADFARVAAFLDTFVPPIEQEHSSAEGPMGHDRIKIIANVGTLTLFPHRRSLILLGRVVETLAESGIVVHSLCTSISALAVNIDFPLLDRAAEVLGKIVELPDDHAPFRPEFCIKQISP